MDARERRSIELDLRSPDEEIRRLAVERTGALPPDEAIALLVECLGDSGWRVRKAAVERLAEAPPAWPVAEALVAALSDGDNPGRRNAAVEALVRRGASVLPPLLEATHSADQDVRKLAVDTLAGLGAAAATGRLLEMLRDPDPNVQAAAADALGALGDPAVAPALLERTGSSDSDRLVAFSALQALARLEVAVPAARLASALADGLLRPAAYAVLGHADDGDVEAEEALQKGLLAPSRAAREAAMQAVVRLVGRREAGEAARLVERLRERTAGEPFAEARERLASGDLSTRLVLIQFLGLAGRADAALSILRAGSDEALAEVALATVAGFGEAGERVLDEGFIDLDGETRRLLCRALARTRGAVGEARLLAALDDPDPELRAIAASALGARRSAVALPVLVRRLEAVAAGEDDPECADELAALTGALVDLASHSDGEEGALRDRAVELLGQRLEGAPEAVRLALATVLGRIGCHRDASLVTWLLKDPSAEVRRAAVQALSRLAPDEAGEPLRLALADESSAVRIAAARALALSPSGRALDDLERLSEDEDPRVRAAALRALGARVARDRDGTPPSVLARLESAFADGGAVALAAVEALGEIGGPEAGRRARGLLAGEDPELVRAAVACIAAHGERDVVAQLVPLVGHPHWAVRAEVIQTLAERSLVAAVPAILRRLETEQDGFVREAILAAMRRLDE